jgi:hypothetical protein
MELQLIADTVRANNIRNQYANAIYSQVAASPTGWRMTMWQSDGGRRNKEFKDISVDVVREDGEFVRKVLGSLFYFGGVAVAYE